MSKCVCLCERQRACIYMHMREKQMSDICQGPITKHCGAKKMLGVLLTAMRKV